MHNHAIAQKQPKTISKDTFINTAIKLNTKRIIPVNIKVQITPAAINNKIFSPSILHPPLSNKMFFPLGNFFNNYKHQSMLRQKLT